MLHKFENKKYEGVDRIEGDTIILHDFYPKKYRELKKVKIITLQEEHIRKIKKTKNDKYLMT